MSGVPPFCGRAARTHPRRPPQEAGKGYNPVLCQAFLSKNGPEWSGPGKNCLPIPKSYSTIVTRRIKGGTWRAGTSPRPYAGDATSHTAEFLRHAHYTGNLPFLQGGKSRCGSVCCIGAVQGSLYPAQPFYSPQPELPAGDGTVPPGDLFGDPAAAWRKNPSCRQRTARGRSGLPDQMSGGFFSAVLPEKIFKIIKPAGIFPALNPKSPEKTKR